ncbi:spore germination protein [Ammoniphilus sp. YIM 78166]|uniref:spore germination protein n=1 Tax=Ammoniphilus sp. YIM 78166 TaxID=1644106 RepID=UPI00106FCEE3|nr:spore germination protein [Ammoniphilus sp. YIM 78166]
MRKPKINNVYNLRVNSLDQNSSVDLGNVFHIGHVSNEETNHAQWLASDGKYSSHVDGNNVNTIYGPNKVDQPQKQV